MLGWSKYFIIRTSLKSYATHQTNRGGRERGKEREREGGREGRREGGREGGGRKGGKGQREEEIVKHNKVNEEHFGVSVSEIHVAMHRQHNAVALS